MPVTPITTCGMGAAADGPPAASSTSTVIAMTARAAVAKNLVVLLAAPIPTPIGAGPRYLLPPRPAAVAHAQPVGRFRCTDVASTRELAHVELFARKLVLLLPAGIGIS